MKDYAKTAIGDIATRQKAQLDLIMHGDRQATSLFGYCLSIMVAAMAGFYSLLQADDLATSVVARAALVPVFLIFLGAFIAGARCMKAVQQAKLPLPGRLGEFWLPWMAIAKAESDGVPDEAELLTSYIEGISGNYEVGQALTRHIAEQTQKARACLLDTIVAALLFFVAGLGLLTLSA